MPPKKLKSHDQRVAALRRVQSERQAAQLRNRGDARSYSLEGLRLSALLSQVQALQAVQGLQELRPRDRNARRRVAFASDPAERARQRQWLTFKADWLEALLEDTLAELLELERHEQGLASRGEAARDAGTADATDEGGRGEPKPPSPTE